jgi:hypothetical protein
MDKLEIVKGVPRPANLPTRGSGEVKYPVADMDVDDYFEVPKEWFFGDEPFNQERYDVKRHRTRVNQAVRGWALKKNKEAKADLESRGQYDPRTFTPIKFTVAARDNGNIGVWRDQ